MVEVILFKLLSHQKCFCLIDWRINRNDFWSALLYFKNINSKPFPTFQFSRFPSHRRFRQAKGGFNPLLWLLSISIHTRTSKLNKLEVSFFTMDPDFLKILPWKLHKNRKLEIFLYSFLWLFVSQASSGSIRSSSYIWCIDVAVTQ